MQKRHLNRSVYLEGTSIVVHRPKSTVNHSSFRHAELVSASGCEPLPIPVLGEILKQVQDDLLILFNFYQTFKPCVMLNSFQHLEASLRLFQSSVRS